MAEDDELRSRRLLRESRARVVGAFAIPPLVGLATGARWRWEPVTGDFYASVSQIIATLFIAVAIEFFALGSTWTTFRERAQSLWLIGVSWTGLFACIRGLAGGGSAVMVGLAAAGLTAASILVSLALYSRIRSSEPELETSEAMGVRVFLLLLAVPVLLLALF